MNLQPIFNQLNIAVRSVIEITKQIADETLEFKPSEDKRSVRELLSHIALVCRADLLILDEASQEQMADFYEQNTPNSLHEIQTALTENLRNLEEVYMNYTEEQLNEITTSYWGVRYSRYEWLLEILCHVVHHRGQLFTLLTYDGEEPKVQLFE